MQAIINDIQDKWPDEVLGPSTIKSGKNKKTVEKSGDYFKDVLLNALCTKESDLHKYQ